MKNRLEKRIRACLEGVKEDIKASDMAEVLKLVGLLDRTPIGGEYVLYRAALPDEKVDPQTKLPTEYVQLKEFFGPTPDAIIVKTTHGDITVPITDENTVLKPLKGGVVERTLMHFIKHKDDYCRIGEIVDSLETIQRKLYADELKREKMQEGAKVAYEERFRRGMH